MKNGVGILIVMAILFLCCGGLAKAEIIKDFNESGTIQADDYYDIVKVWNDANVTMIGGSIYSLETHNESLFYLNGGTVRGGLHAGDSSIMHLFGCDTNFGLGASETSIINIYGYDFELYAPGGTDNYVKGKWANGNSFFISMRGGSAVPHLVLHTIPEPCGIILFGISFLLLKKRGQ